LSLGPIQLLSSVACSLEDRLQGYKQLNFATECLVILSTHCIALHSAVYQPTRDQSQNQVVQTTPLQSNMDNRGDHVGGMLHSHIIQSVKQGQLVCTNESGCLAVKQAVAIT